MIKVSLSHRSPSWGGGFTPWSCQGFGPHHHQHVVLIPKAKWLTTMFAFPCSVHIPLTIPQSHGHSLLQRRLGNSVFTLSSHVLLWSFYQYQNQYWDNSQTLPLKALLKSIEFRFWNKIDYSFPITALHHMVSEFQLTTTANFRRPHLAGRWALWYALWLYHAISTCGSSN